MEEGGQAVKKRRHSIAPLWCALFRKNLEFICGPKTCCFFKLVAVADLMSCNGLLSALEGRWLGRCRPRVPELPSTPPPPGKLGFFEWGGFNMKIKR